ncbi:hypothetical protein AOC36_10365 [Erysipelothrix larvae]|uniref:Transcription regulator PadR N-terminal domain-containing protein n=1 Tax=Erysipelothrix larvae TaxID=1514105 RepID=A0A0X8H1F8_9FIRM|nr:helix-turn-helix transcriptional regulator [Erysipelothrix larvae]AMC94359.1 hypothetical protein AOC36_10365 [Erysipelothrix larvae]
MNNREWLRTGSRYMLLSLLSEREMYGYEIIKELESRSEHVFEMKEGTLYPILHRLEKEGYLYAKTKTSEAGKDRKYYGLTRLGHKQLQEEKSVWKEFSESVEKVVSSTRFQNS